MKKIQELYQLGQCLYSNPFSCEEDIAGFRMEGKVKISFPNGCMRMENAMDPSLKQKSNFLLWCPENFPDSVAFTWNFRPIREPGLAMFFFSAAGVNDRDLFDESLQIRDGQYSHYHSGDINAYHASYFRRKALTERAFHTCNLRKSKGCHMLCQGGDPLPGIEDVSGFYEITVIKSEGEILFAIEDLLIYRFRDDGCTYGPILTSGKVGFRQMAPLVAEYSDFKVHSAIKLT